MAKKQTSKRKPIQEHISSIRIGDFKPLIVGVLAVAVILSAASIGFGLIKQGPSAVTTSAAVSPERATTYPSRIARTSEHQATSDNSQVLKRSHKSFQRR